MIGAVAVGMFNRPEIGVTPRSRPLFRRSARGFTMRLHKGEESPPLPRHGGYFSRALRALEKGRKEDGRPFGRMFGEVVQHTFQSMLFIGGCIMIFSVLVQVIEATGLLTPVKMAAAQVLGCFRFRQQLNFCCDQWFFRNRRSVPRQPARALLPLRLKLPSPAW